MKYSLDQIKKKVKELGSITKAAKELGIPRSTVSGWMHGYNRPRSEPEYSTIETKARELDPMDPVCRSYLVRALRKWRSPVKLAEELGCSEEQVTHAINHLNESGYQVISRGNLVRISKEGAQPNRAVDLNPIDSDERVIGIVADSHLCNRVSRLDVLEAAYDEFKQRKITDVFHAGNMVDGEFKFNRYELLAHGVTDQTLYCLDHYPERSGITTHFITGDCHEGWWRQRDGIDWGKWLVYEARDRGRNDFNYLGFMDVDVALRCGKKGVGHIKVFHPGGGTAYAISYSTQKIVESLQGGEKPGLLICGHYHKAIYHMVRNVHVIQAGTTCDQTSFMRKRKLEAHLGFWIVTLQQDQTGAIRRVVPEFNSYYDKTYHGVLDL